MNRICLSGANNRPVPLFTKQPFSTITEPLPRLWVNFGLATHLNKSQLVPFFCVQEIQVGYCSFVDRVNQIIEILIPQRTYLALKVFKLLRERAYKRYKIRSRF